MRRIRYVVRRLQCEYPGQADRVRAALAYDIFGIFNEQC